LVVSLALRRRRASITALALGGFYLSSLPFRSHDDVAVRKPPGSMGPTSLRPIVHVVLDEQLGVGGFRGIGDTVTAAFLSDFYTGRGFDVYPGAYSRFNDTRPSLATLMSMGEADGPSLLGPSKPGSAAPLSSNPYFARLASEGYRINVYQSANLDYCATPGIAVATCVRVPPTSIANISFLRIPWRSKARLILEFQLVTSSQLRQLLPGLRGLEPRRIFAARALGLMRLAGDDIALRRQRTDFVFVHVLLPHGPYEVDARCVSYLEHLLADSGTVKGSIPDSLRTSREARYRAQVRCTHRVLGELLDRVDHVFGPGEAIIMVHGDHGSRAVHRCGGRDDCRPPAATVEQVRNFRPADFNAEFSTLLAVRGPDSKGVVHWEPVPMQDLLWRFVQSGFQAVPPTAWTHYIHLNSPGDRTYPLQPADMLWVQEPSGPTHQTKAGVTPIDR
jgi:hypothetical protein